MVPAGERAKKRIVLVLTGMGLLAIGLVIQLVRVQFGPYAPVFAERTDADTGLTEKVKPARGLIFDRDGELLAANITVYYLEIEVRQLWERSQEEIAIVLSTILDLPEEDLYQQLTYDWPQEGFYRVRLTQEDENGRRWPIVVDEVTADVIGRLNEDYEGPDLSGMYLVPEYRRVYPSGSLAGHVLGFVNQEGQGFFGVEGYYDEWLSGKPITIERPLIPPDAHLNPDPPAGVNLVLTIDREIQQVVEARLELAVTQTRADGGQVIVMDPDNGEILAMAAWPPLDPGDYSVWLDGDEEGKVITPAVAGLYEPGSTFKVLTMAAALDAGAVQPEDVYVDTGEIEVGGHQIRNWDGEAWGPQTMIGCMEHSLNVCLAYVASERLGASALYEYLSAFGIGQPTGIDLAGEVPGKLRTPRHPEWTESDIGTNSFGQGVSVSPIQLLAAVAALANDGVILQPHVVRQVATPQGVYWPTAMTLGRPITKETTETLAQMLTESLGGETSHAKVAGYELAGKTGTAQIPTPYGYDPYQTIASFVGWGPVEDPRFVILVRLDRPRTSPWGSIVAAPVFADIVERLVVLLEIPPTVVEQPEEQPDRSEG